MAQLNLYAIIALIIAVIALGGGWYISHHISSAEIDTLKQRNAVLTSAVEQNERTIAQMIADAQVLAAANAKLSRDIMKSEIEQAASWNAIDALDLESGTGDATGLETKVNAEFIKSIDVLRTITAK